MTGILTTSEPPELPEVNITLVMDPPFSGNIRIDCVVGRGTPAVLGDHVSHEIQSHLAALVSTTTPLVEMQHRVNIQVEYILKSLWRHGHLNRVHHAEHHYPEWLFSPATPATDPARFEVERIREMLKSGVITHAQADDMIRERASDIDVMGRAYVPSGEFFGAPPAEKTPKPSPLFPGVYVTELEGPTPRSMPEAFLPRMPEEEAVGAAELLGMSREKILEAARTSGVSVKEAAEAFAKLGAAKMSMSEATEAFRKAFAGMASPPHHPACRCEPSLPEHVHFPLECEEDDEWELDDGLFDDMAYEDDEDDELELDDE